MKKIFFTLLLLVATPGYSSVVVDKVIYPAWLENYHHKFILKPGMRLDALDKIQTGEGGRVLLKMDDQSDVQVGSSSKIAIQKLQVIPGKQVNSVIDVLKGAFRYITNKVNKTSWNRSIQFNIGAITVGIRGTDIWGRSNEQQDLLCLIEGKVQVDAEKDSFVMDQPLDYYVKPKDKPAKRDKVDQKKLAKWSDETQIKKGSGAVSANGRWSIVFASYINKASALSLLNKLTTQGYFAELVEIATNSNKKLYRVVIQGFVDKEDAITIRSRLQSKGDYKDAWLLNHKWKTKVILNQSPVQTRKNKVSEEENTQPDNDLF